MDESEYWECRLQGDGHAQHLARVAADLDMKAAEERLKSAEIMMKTRELVYKATQDSLRPFVLLSPRIFPDGDQWCALLGENLQEGVAGFGNTPHEASLDFDRNWMEMTLKGGE